MRKYLMIIFAFSIFAALPANSSAFYQIGDINEYLSYDRFKVITRWEDQNIYHPKLQGRLINKTNERISLVVNIYFCDVHNKRYNSAIITMSLNP